jgi:hypothetical protein
MSNCKNYGNDKIRCKVGPNVVIIGASEGLGAALGEEYGSIRSKVIISSRKEKLLPFVADHIRRKGVSEITIVKSDVVDINSLKNLFYVTEDKFNGCINTVIYNVGQGMQSCFVDIKNLKEFKKVIDVNYKGLVNTMKILIPILIDQYNETCVRAKVVVTICMAGKTGIPTWSIFSAAKHAMVGFMNSIREENKEYFDVILVYPGIMDTSMESRVILSDGSLSDAYNNYSFDKSWFKTNAYYMPVNKAANLYVSNIEHCSSKDQEVFLDCYNKMSEHIRGFNPCLADLLSYLSFRLPAAEGNNILKFPKNLYYGVSELCDLSESLSKCGYKDPCDCPNELPKIIGLQKIILNK